MGSEPITDTSPLLQRVDNTVTTTFEYHTCETLGLVKMDFLGLSNLTVIQDTLKNIVANGLAERCEVQVAYAIGKSEPVSLCVDTFGTGVKSDEELLQIIRNNFNFEVGNILEEIDLRKPIYSKTSCYGHFGDPQFSWEKIKTLTY